MKYRLLVIDDEKMILDMLSMTLGAKGYEVFIASSSEEALVCLEASPDLILLDINMPKMDGLELCRLIRERVSCPILFLTARVREQDKIEGLLAGGDDYITKPFSMEELLARITAHLRREGRHKKAVRIRFEGRLVIDYNSMVVYWGEEVISLSGREYEMHSFFVILLILIGIVAYFNAIFTNLLNRKDDFILMHKLGIWRMEIYQMVTKEGLQSGIVILTGIGIFQVFLYRNVEVMSGMLFVTLDIGVFLFCVLLPKAVLYCIFQGNKNRRSI